MLKMRQHFANDLGVSGDPEAETVLTPVLIACPGGQKSCRTGAAGRLLKARHTWEEMTIFMVAREVWGPLVSSKQEGLHGGWRICYDGGGWTFCCVGKRNLDACNLVHCQLCTLSAVPS